ncbi:MAG: helix-turn-helix domain-containing protein [Jiangellales bacterium]
MSQFSDESTTVPSEDFSGPGSLRVEDQPFALVPEWVIDTDISDAAFRVYSLLLRYGNTSGQRMPSRKLLAVRLHRSVDAVDRAVRELVGAGLLRVEHRRAGRRNLTNRYHLTTADPQRSRSGATRRTAPTPPATPPVDPDAPVGEGRSSAGSRTSAATPDASGGRRSAGRVAAEPRPDPEKKTHNPPPPAPQPAFGTATTWREEEVLIRCAITDLDPLVERCRRARQALDKPTGRWTRHTLHAALQLALTRGWPPTHIETALLTVAADPDTRSPMRLAEAGP